MQEPDFSPEKLFISTVKLGPKGQIVIPKEIRSSCGIQPGDNLVLVAGPAGGFSVHPADKCRGLAAHLLSQLPGVLDVLNQTDPAPAAGNPPSEGDPL